MKYTNNRGNDGDGCAHRVGLQTSFTS